MKLSDILEQKKSVYVIAGIIILIASLLTINGLIVGTRHSQGNILVSVDGYTMTLQEAINNNYLNTGANSPTSAGTPSVSVGHNPSEIWVSIDGSEMTLADAIAADTLCGTTFVPYTGSINPGHLASEIEVTIDGSTKTLQDAIDEGDFCFTYSWQIGSWGSCSVSCGIGTQIRSVTCQRSDSTTVDDSFCTETKPATSQSCDAGSCFCGQSHSNPTRGGRRLYGYIGPPIYGEYSCNKWCQEGGCSGGTMNGESGRICNSYDTPTTYYTGSSWINNNAKCLVTTCWCN